MVYSSMGRYEETTTTTTTTTMTMANTNVVVVVKELKSQIQNMKVICVYLMVGTNTCCIRTVSISNNIFYSFDLVNLSSLRFV